MKVSAFKERNWRRLLTEVQNGHVVPVIGPELLRITHEGKEYPLYSFIARELAERLELDTDHDAPDLSDVIYRYNALPGSDLSEPYYEIWDILREFSFEPPESLKKLAAIRSFDLVITTTFDDLMAAAFNEVRFQGEPGTTSLTYRKGTQSEDIPPSLLAAKGDETIVYHLFGKANTLPTFVATEEDLLEFGHLWQDEDYRAPNLSSLLKDKYLMILGCSYDNWLSRFFLCALKTKKLFEPQKGRFGLFADEQTKKDEELALFLSRCHTQLYHEGGASEFIVELERRWRESAADTDTAAPSPIQVMSDRSESDRFVKGSFFLSYASEDRAIVQIIRDQMENAGLDVWFDQQRLESGDAYRNKILRHIEASSFFLPIISNSVLTKDRRFFRLEWNHAIKESAFRPMDFPFIQPIAIDNTPENAATLPVEFSELHWERLVDGRLSDTFLQLCVKRIKAIRRNE